MKRLVALTVVCAASPLLIAPAQASAILMDGDPGMLYFAPHHGPGNAGHTSGETHYFIQSGDPHHFGWGSATPSSGPTTVFYDFRAFASFTGGSANVITPAQMANAIAAFALWSAATDIGGGPSLIFVQSTVAPLGSIINVGTGPVGTALGLGGGFFNHSGSTHPITGGGATQSSAVTWDTVIGNGDPTGTFDYFTVVVQEIGHALGLGHTNLISGPDMMDGLYGGEQTVLSANDIAHIRSIYGVGSAAAPEPSSMALFALGIACLVRSRWRKDVRR